MEVLGLDEVKNGGSHMASAAAFVEGGIQEACDDACSICLEAFCDSEPSSVIPCACGTRLSDMNLAEDDVLIRMKIFKNVLQGLVNNQEELASKVTSIKGAVRHENELRNHSNVVQIQEGTDPGATSVYGSVYTRPMQCSET